MNPYPGATDPLDLIPTRFPGNVFTTCHQGPQTCCDDEDVCVCDCQSCDCRYAVTEE